MITRSRNAVAGYARNIDVVIGVMVGILAAITVYLSGYQVDSFGLPVILFCVFIALTLRRIKYIKELHFDLLMSLATLLYMLFILIMWLAFVQTHSLSGKDVHYLMSTASNIVWVWLLVYLFVTQRNVFDFFVVSFAFLLSLLIILVWMYGVHLTSNIFYLRGDILDSYLFANTVLHNPNVTARTSLTLLPLLYYLISTNRDNRFINVLGLLCIAGLLIVIQASLSRSNILSSFIFIFALGLSWSVFMKNGNFDWGRGVAFVLATAFIILSISSTTGNRLMTIKDFALESGRLITQPDLQKRHDIDIDKHDFIPEELRALSPRMRAWRASILIVKDNLLFGVGRSSAIDAQQSYGGVAYSMNKYLYEGEEISVAVYKKTFSVHGGFLKIAVYSGVLSLMAFILFYIFMYLYAFKRYVALDYDINAKSASFGMILLLTILIPMNVGADSFGAPVTWVALGVFVAASYQSSSRYK